ncbi:hypothetical protein VE00_10454 [Pseudogymnoascus sp. WSF 3629]|nr:hypothetical protein VE00_10454 [Pseudogymnoascus sp. WSF 3629]
MSRYAKAHAKPNGPSDARLTALQIINDEGVKGKLKGEVIVITGTSSSISIETTRALAMTGATLFLTARDAALSSVRAAAAAILTKTSKIHLLFSTNYLSHFLVYKLSEPALLAAASPDLPSRVVSLASSAHNVHRINNPDNYDF